MTQFRTWLPSVLLCAGLVHGAAAPAGRRPNVLFIAVDDLRPELGCYGCTEIVTPHIDALASGGLTFTRAYCQQAVCNPSRASLMTGLRPDSTRVWDLVTHFRDTVPDVVTLPQHFRRNGYHAAAYGKIFHNSLPDPKSWDEPNHWPKKSTLWSPAARRQLEDYRSKMRTAGKREAAIKRMRAPATEARDVADSQTPDGEIADQAMAAMRELSQQQKAFFLAVGFIRPHLPFVVPRKYWNLYGRDNITLDRHATLPADAPRFAMNTMYELRDYCDFAETPTPSQGALSVDRQRRLKHGYYASVSFVDVQVGRLLAELKALELADDTIVILWGDHGWKLGEHRSWCKQTNYEIDTRVPLIIDSPGMGAKGQHCDALVEFVDIYPTLCELAGVPRPPHLQGRSMAPLLEEPNAPWKKAAFSQFRRRSGKTEIMGYAMRTARYRYVDWRDRRDGGTLATELYDHDTDPRENTNIASRVENKEIIRELGEALWQTLPAPPPLLSALSAPRTPRPKLAFVNGLDESVIVHWLPEEGGRKEAGRIAPGEWLHQTTTLGHRFVAEGTESDFRRFVTVDSAQRAVALKRCKGPNVLFLMADDWSWPHASALGDTVVKTPTFDRMVREGVLFEKAFVSAPSCTPSRMAVATGQWHWRLGEAANLGGSLSASTVVWPELLEDAGYRIGFARKGAAPSKHAYRGRDPFGPRFKSFDTFLEDRQPGEPFCFWYGAGEPHRPYRLGRGKQAGLDPSAVRVPPCLPDSPVVRSDLCDYYEAVQRFDADAGRMLTRLRELGELANTIVVMSSDNGMPFPRCKATLYDLGTRVPLVVRWGGGGIRPGRMVRDLVSLCDLAPTFLEAAGLPPHGAMTGKSLLPVLKSERSGSAVPARTFVLAGVERHVYERPARALRTADWLYIRNFDPDRWPTGEVEGPLPRYDFARRPWPTGPGAFSFAVDPSPTKQFMLEQRNELAVKPIAALSFDRRPQDELYDLRKDPGQVRNVAADPAYASDKKRLATRLALELAASGDPRFAAAGSGGASDPHPGLYPVTAPPLEMKLDPFYRKHVSASGYPIVSSGRVNDYALKEAAYLVDLMLAKRPDVRAAMVRSGSRLIVMAHDEFTTDMPEYARLRPKNHWDRRARGLGGSQTDPVCSCAEENLLAYPGDPYAAENILIHEFAHNMHLRGMVRVDKTFDTRLKLAYDRAIAKGLWAGKYAASNHHEYFAEGVQSWFDNNRQDDHDHNHVNTRKELREYDPALAALCEEVFGDTELVYTKPARRLRGHLEGYDPATAPTFKWPERTREAQQDIMRKVRDRGKTGT